MSDSLHLLLDEIERIQRVLEGIDDKYSRFKDRELAQLGRCDVTAVYVAETLDKYYTAVETAAPAGVAVLREQPELRSVAH